jgi:hypothetical protein
MFVLENGDKKNNFKIISNHFKSFQIISNHFKSFQIISNH